MKQILDKLDTLNTFDVSQIDSIIEDFFEFYEKKERHKYHEITVYVVNKFRKIEESESVSIILSNLEQVIEKVESLCNCQADKTIEKCNHETPPDFMCEKMISEGQVDSKRCYEYKGLHKKLSKLYDHISLEYMRISDIRQQNHEIEIFLETIDSKEKDLQSILSRTTGEVEKIQNTTEKTSNQLNKMQNNYVTILGIFASIVLAFTGGIAFSTSVLENIDAISPFRLTAVVIGLAFVLINVVYILVWFIRELNKNKGEEAKYPGFMIFINAVLIIAMVVTVSLGYKNVNSRFEDESTIQITIEEKLTKE